MNLAKQEYEQIKQDNKNNQPEESKIQKCHKKSKILKIYSKIVIQNVNNKKNNKNMNKNLNNNESKSNRSIRMISFKQNFILNKQQQLEMIKCHKKSEFFIIIQKKVTNKQ